MRVMTRLCSWVVVLVALAAAAAQDDKGQDDKGTATGISAAARAALAEARKVSDGCKGKVGPARSRALEVAAGTYDRLVARLSGEPAAAAVAAWSAAVLWRRHGSLPLAEKDYLHAAKCDPARYAQRALLGAADMQRRQQRREEAAKTYARAAAVDPRTIRAQTARLWIARMLLQDGQVDRAIEKFQAALESAPTPRQAIITADHLCKAWIAKGDLTAASDVLAHVDGLVEQAAGGDPIAAERLRRASERMSARRALRRAADREHEAAKDAVRLDEHRRRRGK
ncbi:MAG TPA: tetratricopeptide repeat protein [bacterium]|nr:tetratricopeptide repeat protein [bacterium]